MTGFVGKARTESFAGRHSAPPGLKPGPYSGGPWLPTPFYKFTRNPPVEEETESPSLVHRSRNFVPALRSCSLHSRRDSHSKISFHNGAGLSVTLHLLLSSRAAVARRGDGGLHGAQSFPFYWTSFPINRKRARAVFDWYLLRFYCRGCCRSIAPVIMPLVGTNSPLRCNPAK